MNETYRWHSQLPLEPPPHTIVDSFWFPPIRRNAFEHVALVAVEVLCACTKTPIITMTLNQLLVLFFFFFLKILVVIGLGMEEEKLRAIERW